MYLLVNVAVLFGTPYYYFLEFFDVFRGVGYLEGGRLHDVFAVYEFEDVRRLEAVKWVFEKVYEALGYKPNSLIKVRKKIPKNFRFVKEVV